MLKILEVSDVFMDFFVVFCEFSNLIHQYTFCVESIEGFVGYLYRTPNRKIITKKKKNYTLYNQCTYLHIKLKFIRFGNIINK